MDHRTVPLEVLRDFARSYAELTSIRIVAEDAGVGRSTVHKFIAAGTMPHARVRRRLALWYLRRLEGVDLVELIRPYVGALAVLLGDFQEPAATRVMVAVLDDLHRGYADEGEAQPRWLTVLRERATGRF